MRRKCKNVLPISKIMFYPSNRQEITHQGFWVLFLHCIFWPINLLSRVLADLAHFNGPELPVDRISIIKKHFFINTNNVKGFFIVTAQSPRLFGPFKISFANKFRFCSKKIIFQGPRRRVNKTMSKCPNIFYTGYWDQYHIFYTCYWDQYHPP
jgi:hypothetical protein